MRRPQGVFNYGGGKNLFREKQIGKFGQGTLGKGHELLQYRLARRPRWGGGSLRAFCRAKVIVDAVLFESYVVESLA